MCSLHIGRIRSAVASALSHRQSLLTSSTLTAYRLIDGAGDDLPGLYLDRVGTAAMLSVYEDAHLPDQDITLVASVALDATMPVGVEAVYVKPFARDRSRLGGAAPDETRSPQPRAGTPQPDTIVVREYASQFEIRPYDGFSTGLFLEHREHRRSLAEARPPRALNLFAYTCAFAVPLVAAGTEVVNVDVSARYLEWGRRNVELNGSQAGSARYIRMDAREYLEFATRRGELFDLVIVDPPTFAAADPRRKRRAWKSLDDYPALLRAASRVVAPGGRIFAASNTRDLAIDTALVQLVESALGSRWTRAALPPWPLDVREQGRVAAVCFSRR